MPAPDRSNFRLPSIRNWLVAIPALAMLTAAEGDCALAWASLQSPVQGVTLLLVQPNGEVHAELLLASTADWREHRWVDSAELVELRVPDGTLIELTNTGEGSYTASSVDEPALVWMPGERYRLTFELDDEEAAGKSAGEEFIAVVETPSETPIFSLDRPPAFVGDTAELSWTPDHLDALIEVRGPDGTLIYTTFDMSTPTFDGSKWASLATGGDHTLPVDVFEQVGEYTLSACLVATQEGFDEELSSALGIGSGFLAGVCVEPIEFTVTE
jgi:hypothetical protein